MGKDQFDNMSADMFEEFDFGDDSSSSESQLGKDIREGLKNTASGVMAGVKSELSSRFPNTNDLVTEAIDTIDDFRKLKEDFSSEIGPAINTLKQVTLRCMPMAERVIPKKWYDKWKKGLEDSIIPPERRAEDLEKVARQEEMTNALGDIFKGQVEAQKQMMIKQDADRIVDQRLRNMQFKASHEVMAKIDSNINTIAGFITGVYTGYLKKSLELKYQSIFVLRDIHKATAAASKILESKLKEISVFTSLPDSAKALPKNARGAIAAIRNSRYDTGSEYMSSFRTRFMKNISDSVMDTTKQFTRQILPGLDMATQMMSSMGVDQKSPLGILGSGLGIIAQLWGVPALSNKIFGGKAGKFADVIEDNMFLGKDRLFNKIRKWAEKHRGEGGILGWLSDKIPQFQNKGIRNSMLDGANEAVPFDNTTRQTIVEVLPRHLERIGNYVEALTKALAPTAKIQQMTFNVHQRKLTTVEEAREDMFVASGIGSKAERAARQEASITEMTSILLANQQAHATGKRGKELINRVKQDKDLLIRFLVNSAIHLEYLSTGWDDIKEYLGPGHPESPYIKRVFNGMNPDEKLECADMIKNMIIAPDTGRLDTTLLNKFDRAIKNKVSEVELQNKVVQYTETFGQSQLTDQMVTYKGGLNNDGIFKVLNQEAQTRTNTYKNGKLVDDSDANKYAYEQYLPQTRRNRAVEKAAYDKWKASGGEEGDIRDRLAKEIGPIAWSWPLEKVEFYAKKLGITIKKGVNNVKDFLSGDEGFFTRGVDWAKDKGMVKEPYIVTHVTRNGPKTYKIDAVQEKTHKRTSGSFTASKEYPYDGTIPHAEIQKYCKKMGFKYPNNGENVDYTEKRSTTSESIDTVTSTKNVRSTKTGNNFTRKSNEVLTKIIPDKLDTIIGILRDMFGPKSSGNGSPFTPGPDIDGAAIRAMGLPNYNPLISSGEGGIVPGTSTTGDKVPALLNSKEWVLNTEQMGRLAAKLGVSTPEAVFDAANGGPRRFAKGGRVGGKRKGKLNIKATKPTTEVIPEPGVLTRTAAKVEATVSGMVHKVADTFPTQEEFIQYFPENMRERVGKMYDQAVAKGEHLGTFITNVGKELKASPAAQKALNTLKSGIDTITDAESRKKLVGEVMTKVAHYKNIVTDKEQREKFLKDIQGSVNDAVEKAKSMADKYKDDIKEKGFIKATKDQASGLLRKGKLMWLKFKRSKVGRWIASHIPDDVKEDFKKAMESAKGDIKKGMDEFKKSLGKKDADQKKEQQIAEKAAAAIPNMVKSSSALSSISPDKLLEDAADAEKSGDKEKASQLLNAALSTERGLARIKSGGNIKSGKTGLDATTLKKMGKVAKTAKRIETKKAIVKKIDTVKEAVSDKWNAGVAKTKGFFGKLFHRNAAKAEEATPNPTTQVAEEQSSTNFESFKKMLDNRKTKVSSTGGSSGQEESGSGDSKFGFEGSPESSFHADFRKFAIRQIKDNLEMTTAVRMITVGGRGGFLGNAVRAVGGIGKAVVGGYTKIATGALKMYGGLGKAALGTAGKILPGAIKGAGSAIGGIAKGLGTAYSGATRAAGYAWGGIAKGIGNLFGRGTLPEQSSEELFRMAAEAEKAGNKEEAERLLKAAVAAEQREKSGKTQKVSSGFSLKSIFQKIIKPKYVDIYEKDKVEPGNPLLTAKQQESGMAAYADGTPIKDSYSITKPVFLKEGDAEPKCVITEEQIKNGLVDVNNKSLSKGESKSGGLRGAMKEGGLKGWGKTLLESGKWIKDTLGGLFSFGKDGKDGDKDFPVMGRKFGIDRLYNKLVDIYTLLQENFKSQEKRDEEANKDRDEARAEQAKAAEEANKDRDTALAEQTKAATEADKDRDAKLAADERARKEEAAAKAKAEKKALQAANDEKSMSAAEQDALNKKRRADVEAEYTKSPASIVAAGVPGAVKGEGNGEGESEEEGGLLSDAMDMAKRKLIGFARNKLAAGGMKLLRKTKWGRKFLRSGVGKFMRKGIGKLLKKPSALKNVAKAAGNAGKLGRVGSMLGNLGSIGGRFGGVLGKVGSVAGKIASVGGKVIGGIGRGLSTVAGSAGGLLSKALPFLSTSAGTAAKAVGGKVLGAAGKLAGPAALAAVAYGGIKGFTASAAEDRKYAEELGKEGIASRAISTAFNPVKQGRIIASTIRNTVGLGKDLIEMQQSKARAKALGNKVDQMNLDKYSKYGTPEEIAQYRQLSESGKDDKTKMQIAYKWRQRAREDQEKNGSSEGGDAAGAAASKDGGLSFDAIGSAMREYAEKVEPNPKAQDPTGFVVKVVTWLCEQQPDWKKKHPRIRTAIVRGAALQFVAKNKKEKKYKYPWDTGTDDTVKPEGTKPEEDKPGETPADKAKDAVPKATSGEPVKDALLKAGISASGSSSVTETSSTTTPEGAETTSETTSTTQSSSPTAISETESGSTTSSTTDVEGTKPTESIADKAKDAVPDSTSSTDGKTFEKVNLARISPEILAKFKHTGKFTRVARPGGKIGRLFNRMARSTGKFGRFFNKIGSTVGSAAKSGLSKLWSNTKSVIGEKNIAKMKGALDKGKSLLKSSLDKASALAKAAPGKALEFIKRSKDVVADKASELLAKGKTMASKVAKAVDPATLGKNLRAGAQRLAQKGANYMGEVAANSKSGAIGNFFKDVGATGMEALAHGLKTDEQKQQEKAYRDKIMNMPMDEAVKLVGPEEYERLRREYQHELTKHKLGFMDRITGKKIDLDGIGMNASDTVKTDGDSSLQNSTMESRLHASRLDRRNKNVGGVDGWSNKLATRAFESIYTKDGKTEVTSNFYNADKHDAIDKINAAHNYGRGRTLDLKGKGVSTANAYAALGHFVNDTKMTGYVSTASDKQQARMNKQTSIADKASELLAKGKTMASKVANDNSADLSNSMAENTAVAKQQADSLSELVSLMKQQISVTASAKVAQEEAAKVNTAETLKMAAQYADQAADKAKPKPKPPQRNAALNVQKTVPSFA